MPVYSTSTSIYIMLPGLTQTEQNTNLIKLHANRVSGIVDSYVGKRYAVSGWTSSSSTPQMIQSISDRLTSEATMRSLYTQDAQNANEWVAMLADEARKELEAIMEGKLAILTSSGSEAGTAAIGTYAFGYRKEYTPVFDMDKDTAWGVDSDLLDQIESDRR